MVPKPLNAITADELRTFRYDTSAYIRYLLRIGTYNKMADMARDLGVKNGRIRQIKYREVNK